MPINQQEKIRLFDYLTRFEKKIKNNRGHYDLSNNQLQTFINENDIDFCYYKAKGINTKDLHTSNTNTGTKVWIKLMT